MRKTIRIGIILNLLLILIILMLMAFPKIDKLASEEIVAKKEIVIDKTPPVITLKEGTITIIENTEYIEPGYEAIDNLEGDITNKVITTTNLDITTPGTYEIIYEVSDSFKNITKASRNIIVEKKKIERKKTYTTTKTDNESINNYMKSVSDYLKKYKVSVGYINLDNGFTYIYNGNKEYFGASLIKVIDAMYIYENNLLDSKTKNQVKQAISVSSNPAHAYLVNKIGKKNLNQYIKEISFRTPQCNSGYYCQTTVNDQLSYWLYLHYLLEENEKGEELKSYFINNVGNHLSYSLEFDNLHKYGASQTYFHDVGMFYNVDSPYIVVVLTNEIGTYPKSIKYLFRSISKMIGQLNDLVETNY